MLISTELKRTIVFSLFLICAALYQFSFSQKYTSPSTNRSRIDISGNQWKFLRSNTQTGAEAINFNDNSWTTVTVPHTFNTKSDRNYNRNCWYRTRFTSTSDDSIGSKRFYLYFEAVSHSAYVYLNGILLGEHHGAYTAFIFDATEARRDGENVLALRVNNRDYPGLPATENGWARFGGITRNVWILKADKYCIDPTDFASSGVYISQTSVSGLSARFSIRTMVRNHSSESKRFTVRNIVCDSIGSEVTRLENSVTVEARSGNSVSTTGSISNPSLWSFGNPYMYRVYTEIIVDGNITDALEERTGFRYYNLTSNNFLINGEQKLIRGACLHAEDEYKGAALDSATIHSQLDIVQDYGMNFIRLVHYPHSKTTHKMTDNRGIGVKVETGLYHNFNSVGNTIRDNNVREMVKQNFNHPSILFWCAGNENFVNSDIERFASVIKALDNTRPVVYASSGQRPRGELDYIFHNIYHGWYAGPIEQFPNNQNWISETGSGGVITTHQNYNALNWTVDRFEPEEYSSLVNEYKFNYIFNSNPTRVPFYTHWLLFDFADYKYKGLNTKGLFTYAMMPKDAAYLWKAKARPDVPLVYINGKHWYLRRNVRDIKVYSNRRSITLNVNGTNRGIRNDGDYNHPSGGAVINDVFFFENVLDRGKNVVIAAGGGHSDTAIIYYTGNAPDAPPDESEYITDLRSSNSDNPAYFINIPVQRQWPVYYQCDGNADNSFDTIPSILSGARWIATRRQSISGSNTNLSLGINSDLNDDVDVFVMFTRQSSVPAWLSSGGFTNTGVTGRWRNNSMNLVDYQLYSRSAAPGSTVNVGSSAIDFVVLIKGESECIPVSITPYLRVNSGEWQQTGNITIDVGSSLTFGPQPVSGGSWSWSGPGDLTASTREITISDIGLDKAGEYVATHRNPGGCESYFSFDVEVVSVSIGKNVTAFRPGAVIESNILRITAIPNSVTDVTVLNLRGAVVFRKSITGHASIPLNSILPKGNFVINVKNNNKMYLKRMILLVN